LHASIVVCKLILVVGSDITQLRVHSIIPYLLP